MLEESPATAWLPAACSAILLTRPCGTDPLLGLFVANVCVTATPRATEGETGAAAPQLQSQAWLKQAAPAGDCCHRRITMFSP